MATGADNSVAQVSVVIVYSRNSTPTPLCLQKFCYWRSSFIPDNQILVELALLVLESSALFYVYFVTEPSMGNISLFSTYFHFSVSKILPDIFFHFFHVSKALLITRFHAMHAQSAFQPQSSTYCTNLSGRYFKTYNRKRMFFFSQLFCKKVFGLYFLLARHALFLE